MLLMHCVMEILPNCVHHFNVNAKIKSLRVVYQANVHVANGAILTFLRIFYMYIELLTLFQNEESCWQWKCAVLYIHTTNAMLQAVPILYIYINVAYSLCIDTDEQTKSAAVLSTE